MQMKKETNLKSGILISWKLRESFKWQKWKRVLMMLRVKKNYLRAVFTGLGNMEVIRGMEVILDLTEKPLQMFLGRSQIAPDDELCGIH